MVVEADRNTESRLLLLVTPRYSKSALLPVSAAPAAAAAAANGPLTLVERIEGCWVSKSPNPLMRFEPLDDVVPLDPKNFMKPLDFSISSLSSAKSGEMFSKFLPRFLRNTKKAMPPIKTAPTTPPTTPPIILLFLGEMPVPPESRLALAAVGTVTSVVMVVSGNTLMVEMYEEAADAEDGAAVIDAAELPDVRVFSWDDVSSELLDDSDCLDVVLCRSDELEEPEDSVLVSGAELDQDHGLEARLLDGLVDDCCVSDGDDESVLDPVEDEGELENAAELDEGVGELDEEDSDEG